MQLEEIRQSGLLELYVIGDVSDHEIKLVEEAVIAHPELASDIDEIEETLERLAFGTAIEPDVTTKPLILTQVNYIERLAQGEEPSVPPILSPTSKIVDFQQWLDREDLGLPEDFEDMSARIIGATEECTTMITWLKYGAPDETHTSELESFLVVEGECDIIIGDISHHLVPGDYISIPLHINHRVEVTSSIPCKVILERKAA